MLWKTESGRLLNTSLAVSTSSFKRAEKPAVDERMSALTPNVGAGWVAVGDSVMTAEVEAVAETWEVWIASGLGSVVAILLKGLLSIARLEDPLASAPTHRAAQSRPGDRKPANLGLPRFRPPRRLR